MISQTLTFNISATEYLIQILFFSSRICRLRATVEVEILADINLSALPNFNNVTCFNFHDFEIFSIELHDK